MDSSAGWTPSPKIHSVRERNHSIFIKLHILVVSLNRASTYCLPFWSIENIFVVPFRYLTHSYFLAPDYITGCSRWFGGLKRRHNLEKSYDILPEKHCSVPAKERMLCFAWGRRRWSVYLKTLSSTESLPPHFSSLFSLGTNHMSFPLLLASGLVPN